MPDFTPLPKLPEPKLPFWLAGTELSKLARSAHQFFTKIGEACIWPARQMNPQTASIPILNLLAWQRCIKRYGGEPERLFRLRVEHAYANAKDAGLIIGWKRIFKRLELGDVELEERREGQDWDIIGIVIDDASLPDKQNVMEIIVDDFGRTCRRYRFVSRITQNILCGTSVFDCDYSTVEAVPGIALGIDIRTGIGLFDNDFSITEL